MNLGAAWRRRSEASCFQSWCRTPSCPLPRPGWLQETSSYPAASNPGGRCSWSTHRWKPPRPRGCLSPSVESRWPPAWPADLGPRQGVRLEAPLCRAIQDRSQPAEVQRRGLLCLVFLSLLFISAENTADGKTKLIREGRIQAPCDRKQEPSDPSPAVGSLPLFSSFLQITAFP